MNLTYDEHNFVINLKLLKRFRFYHIFDPNERKVFGRNVYWLVYLVYTAIILCLMIFSLLGYIVNTDGVIIDVNIIITIGIYAEMYQLLWQIFVFLYHADAIWEIFEVARFDFLKSKRCTENVSMLHDERTKSIWITNLYVVLTSLLMIIWIIVPFIINWLNPLENSHRRAENIFNLAFPVNVRSYNHNYIVYFFIEMIILVYFTLSHVIFDVFIISICRIIVVQYEVLTRAFKSTGENVESYDIGETTIS